MYKMGHFHYKQIDYIPRGYLWTHPLLTIFNMYVPQNLDFNLLVTKWKKQHTLIFLQFVSSKHEWPFFLQWCAIEILRL